MLTILRTARAVLIACCLPAALLALAIIFLAHPMTFTPPEVERQLTNVQFLLDTSGSMAEPHGSQANGRHRRFDSAMESLEKFLGQGLTEQIPYLAKQERLTIIGIAYKDRPEDSRRFLADLGDIQKVLSTDLTASGVKGLRSTVSSANSNYKNLNRKINSALEEMQEMEKALSTEAK